VASRTEESAPGGVQSVTRAFYLLELISAAGGELAISELADRSGLPLPTIHRIIRTLITSGYVIQQPSRRYALGPRLIGLGETASRMLGAWVRPRLTSLVEAVGETANMAILDGDKAVYIAQVPSKHSMRMFNEVGRRVDLHCTGVGKALLAQLPPATALEIVRRTGMPARTKRSITDPDELMEALARVRECGYVIDDGEQEIGVRCVAVPVPNAPSPTTISVSGPETRLTPDIVERVVPHLLDAAAGLDRHFTQSGTR
jgi:IclR family transcriptional regulator, acetate operon repressor